MKSHFVPCNDLRRSRRNLDEAALVAMGVPGLKKVLAQARRDALAMWGSLAETGMKQKSDVPQAVYQHVKDDTCTCPLCTIYRHTGCSLCPLGRAAGNCGKDGTPFNRWDCGSSVDDRRSAAREIARLIRRWRPGAEAAELYHVLHHVLHVQFCKEAIF